MLVVCGGCLFQLALAYQTDRSLSGNVGEVAPCQLPLRRYLHSRLRGNGGGSVLLCRSVPTSDVYEPPD